MQGFIGIFWYINNKQVFIIEKSPLENEMKLPQSADSLHITAKKAHFMSWTKYQEQYGNADYKYYPRGRVNYNVKNKVFEIDMDGCLHADAIIAKLIKEFQLDEKKVRVVEPIKTNRGTEHGKAEGHYTCHLCNLHKSGNENL